MIEHWSMLERESAIPRLPRHARLHLPVQLECPACKASPVSKALPDFVEAADAMDRLQEVFGGNAASDEYHIGRHVSNLFVTQT